MSDAQTIHAWGNPGCEWQQDASILKLPNTLDNKTLEKFQKLNEPSIGCPKENPNFTGTLKPARLNHCPPDKNDVKMFCDANHYLNESANKDWISYFAYAGKCPPEAQMISKEMDKFRYLAKSFYEKINDSKMAQLCCSGSSASHHFEDCKRRWTRTVLLVLYGLPPDDVTANTGDDNGIKISFSTGAISNCRSQGCIDHLILHELGHACSRADNYGVNGYHQNVTQHERHFLKVVGSKEALNCLRKSLLEEASKHEMKAEVNLDAWFEEAMASASFSQYWSSEAFAWDCAGTEDWSHASSQSYMGCYSKIPATAKRICPLKNE